jgi:heat shock protein HtpX
MLTAVAAVRLGIASAAAVMLLALAPVDASASARLCAKGVSVVGVEERSGTRFDGVQAKVMAQSPTAEPRRGGDGLAVVVAIGDLQNTYVALMLSPDRRGDRWVAGVAWRRAGVEESHWVRRGSTFAVWRARQPHLLRIAREEAADRWSIGIDGRAIVDVPLEGSSGGLSRPRVESTVGEGDGSCSSTTVLRFADVRARPADSAAWRPFPNNSVDVESPGYRLDRHGPTSFVVGPGTAGTTLWLRLFLVEGAVAVGVALVLFFLWGWAPLRRFGGGRRYPRRDRGLTLRLGLALFFLALLYMPFCALLVILVYGATGSVAAAALAALGELALALSLPAFAQVVAVLRWRPRLPLEGEAREPRALLERLAALADVPTPRLALSAASVPEALTIGRPGAATIIVTETLLERLDSAELEAVLAHELAHIANADAYVVTLLSLPMNVVGVFVRPIVNLPDRFTNRFLRWTLFGVLSVGVASLLFLVWIPWALAGLIVSTVSRYREYVADQGAALISSPAAVMSALLTISDELRRIPARDLREAACMNAFFVVPTPSSRGGFSLDPARLFPSHPPLERRLARLAETARRLGRPDDGIAPYRPIEAVPPARRRNLAASVSFLAAILSTLLLFALNPFAGNGAAAPLLVFASGIGLVGAFYAVGRAQAGAAGLVRASVGLALFLLPWLLAVDGALSYFVAVFLHLA